MRIELGGVLGEGGNFSMKSTELGEAHPLPRSVLIAHNIVSALVGHTLLWQVRDRS